VAIADLFAGVLDVAPNWTADESPWMTRRDQLLADCADSLREVLDGLGPVADGLRVKAGGRQANYSPLPWIRVFDPAHSPTAQAGFYAVYLFAADGSVVFASLNQGTSEWRANKMRPIRSDEVLLGRAAVARRELEHDAELARIGLSRLELRPDSVEVNPESRRRMRNYELANVFGIPYERHALPPDDRIRQDLLLILPALRHLYVTLSSGVALDLTPVAKDSPYDSSETASSRLSGRNQGRSSDPLFNSAVERQAEAVISAHYESQGWVVQRVGHLNLGFDLRCLRGGEELHVEVKGSSGSAMSVNLTPNEVQHALNYPAAALGVVSGIEVGEDYSILSPGEMRLLDPWVLEDDRLIPTSYLYRVVD
jgi:hypothetical protein